MVLAAHEALGGPRRAALAAGAALEMVHAYSLAHDDLPSMDNDDFRRGRPTLHKAFGEAQAILAGDALLTLSFEVLAQCPGVSPKVRAHMVAHLAQAAGPQAMVGGQWQDLFEDNQSEQAVLSLHEKKTSALFSTSCMLGGLVSSCDNDTLSCLSDFGRLLGLAYQVKDDIEDEKRDRQPPNLACLLGRKAAEEVYLRIRSQIQLSLAPLGEKGKWLLALEEEIMR